MAMGLPQCILSSAIAGKDAVRERNIGPAVDKASPLSTLRIFSCRRGPSMSRRRLWCSSDYTPDRPAHALGQARSTPSPLAGEGWGEEDRHQPILKSQKMPRTGAPCPLFAHSGPARRERRSVRPSGIGASHHWHACCYSALSGGQRRSPNTTKASQHPAPAAVSRRLFCFAPALGLRFRLWLLPFNYPPHSGADR